MHPPAHHLLAILAGHRGRRDRTNADTAKGDLADLIAMMGPGGVLSAPDN